MASHQGVHRYPSGEPADVAACVEAQGRPDGKGEPHVATGRRRQREQERYLDVAQRELDLNAELGLFCPLLHEPGAHLHAEYVRHRDVEESAEA